MLRCHVEIMDERRTDGWIDKKIHEANLGGNLPNWASFSARLRVPETRDRV
jgi:hypothetical protein